MLVLGRGKQAHSLASGKRASTANDLPLEYVHSSSNPASLDAGIDVVGRQLGEKEGQVYGGGYITRQEIVAERMETTIHIYITHILLLIPYISIPDST